MPAREGLREVLCTLGNGYMGTRGAAPESYTSRIHYPGTYIAGVYNKVSTHIAGRLIYNEDFVNCPNWLPLTFKIEDGDWIWPFSGKILSYHQELDMRKGLLLREMRIQDKQGRVTLVKTQRIVHMGDPHRAAIRYVIKPENYRGRLTIRSGLDGTVQNRGVARYRQLNSRHLRARSAGSFGKNGIYLLTRTSQSRIELAAAAKILIFSGGRKLRAKSKIAVKKKKAVYQYFEIFARRNQSYDVEKIVSIYTSHDKGIQSPLREAVSSAKNSQGFDTLFKSHRKAWDALWRKFDIQVEGDSFSQQILRFHTFHLLQTASFHNTSIDAGFPARGLHGEAYRGHIFWDELFVMPLFDFHTPKISKALLLYRYLRLHQARKDAYKNGYEGSMFPWQSGSTGEEETQTVHLNPMSGRWGSDYSHNQRHVSFAIAYNFWSYWKRTQDLKFLSQYGAEVLLSIAQFGASIAKYSKKDKRYHTEGLMGPDEFHERLPETSKAGFKDNTYTNLLIAWTLQRAEEVLRILPPASRRRILKKLELDQKELTRWRDISRRMNIFINREGIISQFEGYFTLRELNWELYRKKYENIGRMDRILKAEGKSPNDYKVAKQADVLMIFYLLSFSEIKRLFNSLGYEFNRAVLKKNYQYYIRRTSHGSTLSKVVHCYVSSLLGRKVEAWDWYLEVLKSDIYDTQGGTTPEGIHAGVMGGSINIAIKAFAGVEIVGNRLKINPRLPDKWKSIKFNLRYKKRWIELSVDRKRLTIFIPGPRSRRFVTPIEIGNRTRCLYFGKVYTIPLKMSKHRGDK